MKDKELRERVRILQEEFRFLLKHLNIQIVYGKWMEKIIVKKSRERRNKCQ